MALFRNFGVNHALCVTGLESLVRRTGVRLRAIPPISLNLQKIAHFWIGNLPVPLMKLWMDTNSYHWHQYRSITGASDYFLRILRVHEKISSQFGVLKRPAGKVRKLGISGYYEFSHQQPDVMHRPRRDYPLWRGNEYQFDARID